MAAGKRGRKTAKSARRTSRRTSRRTEAPKRNAVASDRKFGLLVSNLVMFGIVFIISLGLYFASSNEFYANLFWMIGMVTGFIALGLLIAYLVFVVLRYLRK